MGFQVIEGELRNIWVPVNFANAAKTVYEGAIVEMAMSSSVASGEGIQAIAAASGHNDASGLIVPFGIVLAGNDANPTYDSTYKGQKLVSCGSQALQVARDFRGAEGMFAKGDPQVLAKVAVIGPNTIIKGPLFYGGYGTVLPTVTNTVQSTDGLLITHLALTPTVLAYNHTWYCTKGANKGLYRTGVNADATPTNSDFYIAWPYDIEVGDTFRYCCLRLGYTKAQFDTQATYIEQSAVSYASNDYGIEVLEINLAVSGQEYAIFKFNADHFCAYRA
jgi:hypothetical protein